MTLFTFYAADSQNACQQIAYQQETEDQEKKAKQKLWPETGWCLGFRAPCCVCVWEPNGKFERKGASERTRWVSGGKRGQSSQRGWGSLTPSFSFPLGCVPPRGSDLLQGSLSALRNRSEFGGLFFPLRKAGGGVPSKAGCCAGKTSCRRSPPFLRPGASDLVSPWPVTPSTALLGHPSPIGWLSAVLIRRRTANPVHQAGAPDRQARGEGSDTPVCVCRRVVIGGPPTC